MLTRYRVGGYFAAKRHKAFTGEFHTEKTGDDFMVALAEYIRQEASYEADDNGEKPEFHLTNISTIRRRVVEL
jgi:hypothetical protein